MPFGGLLTVGLITAGVGAGTSLYENNKAAGAAQKATDQSLALQKQMYDTTRADLSPYAQTGTAALGNLRQLTGLPATLPTTPSNPPPGGIPASTMPGGVPGQTAAPANAQPIPFSQNGAPMSPQAQSPVQMQTSSGYVTIRAPDGSLAQVDPAHVARATQLGGKLVSQ